MLVTADAKGRPVRVSKNFRGVKREAEDALRRFVSAVEKACSEDRHSTVAVLLARWLDGIEGDRCEHWLSGYDRPKPGRFTRGSRKHRIGHASARHVIDTVTPTVEADDITQAVVIWWVGNDERGRELEIMAIERPDCRLVVHVMPTRYQRNQ